MAPTETMNETKELNGMGNVVVIYHSGYGHTQRLAQEVAKGAQARLIEIDAGGNISPNEWAMLDAAAAIVMGSPTYMGTVSWQFKKFADTSSKAWYAQKWKDKLAGGFTVSSHLSGDKLSTLQYMVTLAMQHGMLWAGQTEPNTEFRYTDGINRLGSSTGVMAQCGPQDPASAIPQGDLDTALAYGRRMAMLASQLKG